MELSLENCRIRSWRRDDASAVSRHADNRKIWLNVRDHFPHPYTLADAELWIDRVLGSGEPETQFAIDVGGEAVGGVGLFLQEDVSRRSAEIGYWLSESYWIRFTNDRNGLNWVLTSACQTRVVKAPSASLTAL